MNSLDLPGLSHKIESAIILNLIKERGSAHSENTTLYFSSSNTLKFLVRLAFSITINKSQGQSSIFSTTALDISE